MWNGVWKDLLPLLVTCTTYDDGREDSWDNAGLGILAGGLVIISLYGGVFKSFSV
jgi:hypothetical protein